MHGGGWLQTFFDQLLAHGTLVLATVIGGGQLIIARRQALIAQTQADHARRKLKLDLFDRRMAVYEIVRNALRRATATREINESQQVEFLIGIRSAKWLFGPDVSEYLDKILWPGMLSFGLHNSLAEGQYDDEAERLIHTQARTRTLNWIAAQIAEFDDICAPYLHLDR